MDDDTLSRAYAQAKHEIEKEDFETAVEREKQRLRTRVPFWHKIFPYKIVRR